MATYIMLSNLTDEGRKTLKERPERLQAVNKEIESMGARVTAQYAVLGGMISSISLKHQPMKLWRDWR